MWLKLKMKAKMSKGKYVSKIKTVIIYVGRSIKFFLSLNWIYEEYFLLKILENSHQCVPFGLFSTNINWLLLLILLSLSVFLYLFWILSPLNDIKYQLCYLKRCLFTRKLYLFIVTRFFLLSLFFFCVCWKLYITA